MLRNILLAVLVTMTFQLYSQDLEQIRTEYPFAENSEQITQRLNEAIASLPADNMILMGYKGALKTLQAKFARKVRDKKKFFKEGVGLIEEAIGTNPENIELRYIRLTVQENAPRIVGYSGDIEEDKNFIINNFGSTASKLKTIIKNFAMVSSNFNEGERALLK